jgi:hypothetical protein
MTLLAIDHPPLYGVRHIWSKLLPFGVNACGAASRCSGEITAPRIDNCLNLPDAYDVKQPFLL